MPALRVRNVLDDRILVDRESARKLGTRLRDAMASGGIEIVLDFDAVEGMAPSFLDELLSVLESAVVGEGKREVTRVIVANPPARLSLKFKAVARARRMSIELLPDGSWLLIRQGSGS